MSIWRDDNQWLQTTFGDSNRRGNTVHQWKSNGQAMKTVEVRLFILFLKKTFGPFIEKEDTTHYQIDMSIFPPKDDGSETYETDGLIWFEEDKVWEQISHHFTKHMTGLPAHMDFTEGNGGHTYIADRKKLKLLKKYFKMVADEYITQDMRDYKELETAATEGNKEKVNTLLNGDNKDQLIARAVEEDNQDILTQLEIINDVFIF